MSTVRLFACRSRFMKSLLLSAIFLLSACQSTQPVVSKAAYDLGPALSAGMIKTAAPSFLLNDIRSSSALESTAMWYRLYDQPQQLKAFAYARWTSTPAELLSLRLKQLTAQHGGRVLQRSSGELTLPQVQIELDEAAQHFSSASQSVFVLSGRILIQTPGKPAMIRAFSLQQAAGSDAASGALAAQKTADQLIETVWQLIRSAGQNTP